MLSFPIHHLVPFYHCYAELTKKEVVTSDAAVAEEAALSGRVRRNCIPGTRRTPWTMEQRRLPHLTYVLPAG
jgi:hypothetical protein